MTSADFDKRVLTCVRRNAGIRADEIAVRIGEPVVDVSASLRRLKGDPRRPGKPRVKRAGNTRGATYVAL